MHSPHKPFHSTPSRVVSHSATCACVMLFAYAPAAADPPGDGDPMDQPLVTDRTDFTESTEPIPAGHAQLEAGYTFTFDRENEDRVRDHTAGELLLRIGVVDNFELRIGWDGYSWTDNLF